MGDDAVSMEESVLELVSCVQQERGITCGWVAGCGSLDYFGTRLGERRAATDAAITKEVALIFPWVSPELVQLRGEVDRAVVHHRHIANDSLTTDAAADAAAADADAGAAVDADAAGDADEADRRERLKRQLQQRPPLPSTPPSAPAIEASEREPPASAPAGPGGGVRVVSHAPGQRASDAARDMCEAASRGDVARLELLIAADGGNDVNLGDYDRRTPLHLAAAEGFLGVTTFLIERAGAQHSPLDRWHGTPLQDAERSGHTAVASYLAAQGAVSGAPDAAAGRNRDVTPEELRRGNAIFYRLGARAPRGNVNVAETFYDIFVRMSQLISRVIEALDDGALLKPPCLSCATSTSPSSSQQQLGLVPEDERKDGRGIPPLAASASSPSISYIVATGPSGADPAAADHLRDLGSSMGGQQRTRSRAEVASLAFARLKEATGVEHAFLCGMLALPEASLPELPSRAFAGFVLVVQEQRSLETTVRATAPPRLLELIRSGLEYVPELQAVRTQLRDDFDVRATRRAITIERFWELMGEHVDKLERLQQLLLTAKAKTVHAGADTASSAAADLGAALSRAVGAMKEGGGGRRALNIAEVAQRLAELPAEELKAEVLHALEAGGSNSTEGGSKSGPGGSKAGSAKGRGMFGGRCTPSPPSSFASHLDRLAEPTAEAPLEVGGVTIPACERIQLDSLKLLRRIGAGAMGTMYLARWGEKQVALKAAAMSDLDAWLREVAALQTLRHPNIVKYLGAVIEPPTHALVLEYLDGRDLTAALALPTPAGFLMQVASGVAGGMAYLHSERVMHRDLKGGNVLLGAAGEVKITDFGLCVRAPDDTRRGDVGGGHLTAETGTYRWMAPEVIRHEKYSRSADVYSFAMILFELLTHEVPFADRAPLQAAAAAALQHARPQLPRGAPARLRELVVACWSEEPAERPSFKEALATLAELGPRLTAAERGWLDEPAGHPVYDGPSGAGELERRRRGEGARAPPTPAARPASSSTSSSPDLGRRSRRPTSEPNPNPNPPASGAPARHGTRSPGMSRSASREEHGGGGASEAAAGGGGGGSRASSRRQSKEAARQTEPGDAPHAKDTPWWKGMFGKRE